MSQDSIFQEKRMSPDSMYCRVFLNSSWRAGFIQEITWKRLRMLSIVTVLSAPTSYDLIKTVCLYPTPPSMMTPWRCESTNCFLVGVFFCLSCSPEMYPFSETAATDVKVAETPELLPGNTSGFVALGPREAAPLILKLPSFGLFRSFQSLPVEHRIWHEAGQEKQAIPL